MESGETKVQASQTGLWRNPRNTAAHQKGGIHDDDTATDLGFRGGTVAGSIHMEQFTPLLEESFGDDWWRTGTLSLYFRSATVDQEPVRCLVYEARTEAALRRADVWMENEAGTVIMSGSASVGGTDETSELRKRLKELRPVNELRILKNMSVGDTSGPIDVRIADALVDAQLKVITEPLGCYQDPSRFGGRVLPATGMVRIFDPAEQVIAKAAIPPFVGMYGAIELEYLSGPVLSETDYQATATVIGLSDSPKTEILWRECVLTQDAKPIARMLKMDRLLKDSSPLWQTA
jgi:hypothetical protein